MCWIGDTSKFKTAEKDIPIYKVMRVTEEGNFVSYFMEYLYKKDTLVTSELEFGYNMITQALHSYSIENTKVKICSEIFCGKVISDITILNINDNIVEKYVCFTKNGLVLGYIPKGSDYCENAYGEIVSNQLVMTKICSEKELKELSK